MSDNDVTPLKAKERKLSKFLAEEMLYDYISKNLDPNRVETMEEFLRTSAETEVLRKQMEGAMKYCAQLADTQVSEPMLKRVAKTQTFFRHINDKIAWSHWPETARWTLEAFVISSLAAVVVIFFWPKISQWVPSRPQDVILAQVDKADSQQNSAPSEIEPVEETPLSSEPASVAAVEPPQAQSDPASMPYLSSQTKEDLPNSESSIDAGGTETAAPSPADENEIAAAQAPVSAKARKETAAPRGVVYRATMSLENLDILTDQLRELLEKLGAEKAGDVRLGWRKPNGSYFHFSLPESNYDQAMQSLRTFGPVRISKDPHWRVMPEGKIRFILWVEDLAATESTQEP